ncbi:MAG: hypothetical protein ACREIE_06095 [Nitrospiraceae bacterium]
MALAARGSRNLDTGEEKIQDTAVVRELRRQARRVHIESILAATWLTALYLIPY